MHRAAVVHAGELASTTQEVEEIIPVHAVCRGACGVGKYHCFAFQLVTGGAVREAMQEYLLHPTVHEGGHGEPKHGELQYNGVCLHQVLLLGRYVDGLVRVQTVQVYRAALGKFFLQNAHDGFVCHGVVHIRVPGDNEYVFHKMKRLHAFCKDFSYFGGGELGLVPAAQQEGAFGYAIQHIFGGTQLSQGQYKANLLHPRFHGLQPG